MKNYRKLMKQAQLKRNRKEYFQKRLNFTFEVINWLYENQKSFHEFREDYRGHMLITYPFDYPDYAGMPKKMANKLSPDIVDHIQEMWELLQQGNCSFSTIMDFLVIV